MKWYRVTVTAGRMHYLRGCDEKSVRERFEKDYPKLGKVLAVQFLRHDN